MGFDLSNVMAAASAATQGTGDGSNYPPIIYPGQGTVSVRLLFNPKSNQVMRLIRRHKLDSGKVDCAAQWGYDCPVCKAIDTIKDVKGLDLWTLKSKTYGLAYAQFISASTGYDWGSRKAPARGDLVVLMFPWSVYKQMSGVIQKSGEHANEILTDNAGRVITIERTTTADNRVEYRVDVDAFAEKFQSTGSQMEFEKYLSELPDLNDTITPSALPDGHLMKLQLESDNLNARYIGGQTYTPGAPVPQQAPQQYAQPQQYNAQVPPQQVPQMPPVAQPAPQQNYQAPNQTAQQTPPWNTAPEQATAPAPAPEQVQAPAPAPAPQQMPPQVNEQPQVQQSPEPAQADGVPECMGNLNLKDKKCLICAHTMACRAAQKNS